MVNDGQSNSNQTLITTVAIVFLAGFVIGGRPVCGGPDKADGNSAHAGNAGFRT